MATASPAPRAPAAQDHQRARASTRPERNPNAISETLERLTPSSAVASAVAARICNDDIVLDKVERVLIYDAGEASKDPRLEERSSPGEARVGIDPSAASMRSSAPEPSTSNASLPANCVEGVRRRVLRLIPSIMNGAWLLARAHQQ